MIDNVFDHEGKPIQCKELSASFGMFCSEKSISFQVDDLEISVVQSKEIPIARQIKIVAKKDVAAQYLYDTFVKIAMLIMLAEGRFPQLLEIKFEHSQSSSAQLDDLSKECIKRIPPFFHSSDITRLYDCQLLDIDSILNAGIYSQWNNILKEADIMHNIFLSVLSNGLYGNDLKLAFMVETAESMIELVQSRTFLFNTYKPGTSSTPLKMCIDGLITTYGQDIFDKELNGNYDQFLTKSKDSRIRIMHIKRAYNKDTYKEKDAILFLIKYSFLYRRILLELLGVPYSYYSAKLKDTIKKYEQWHDNHK